MKKNNWIEINKSYWNSLARKYNSLYNDAWSLNENEYIIEKLKHSLIESEPNILDLGCGTGLAFSFCNSIVDKIEYTGLDISNEMLEILKNDFPSAKTINGKMSDLSMIQTNSIDNVISIFTSFSYTDDIDKTISEIARVLKPNGKIVISVLSRYSFRRLFSLKFGKFEHYRSRGTISKEYSEAWDLTRKSLFLAFDRHGFKNINIEGYNPFSGFTALTKLHPKIWILNLKIGKLLPFLSHELILTSQIDK